MAYSFCQRKSAVRPLRCLQVIIDRAVGRPRFSKMPSNDLRQTAFGAKDFFFEQLGHTQMNRPASLAQQRGVGSILYQGVLESVGRMRGVAVRGRQSSLHELAKRLLQVLPRPRRYTLQQFEGKFSADDRS